MKLHPDFDTVLAGILSQDPEAYIVLLASETQEVWKEQLRRRFRSSLGGANDALRRVLFVSTLPYAEFMALLSFADVILDPFPFGGGVTTLDALALGVYVLRAFLPRVSLDLLDWLTHSHLPLSLCELAAPW